MDSISREMAKQKISELCRPEAGEYAENPHIDAVMDVLDDLPCIDGKDTNVHTNGDVIYRVEWISVKDREPEEYGEFLITWTTHNKRFIGFAEYEKTGVWDDEKCCFKGEWLPERHIKNYNDWEVVAWMPLPDPYAGEEG